MRGAGAREHIPGVDDEQVVAPNDRAVAVDDPEAVGVAVEPDPEVRALVPHRCDEVLQVGDDRGVGMMVREGAVALGMQQHRLNADRREQRGRDEGAHAVATVDDDLHRPREAPDAVGDVDDVTSDDLLMAYCSLPRRERSRLEQVPQTLQSVTVKRSGADADLESVELWRVVRTRNLDATRDAEVMQTPVQERRRDEADVDH